MLIPTYDMLLVFASIAVSIMASLTGLVLTRGIQALPANQRKTVIVMASLALGGGIWSMHFVAMLAMQMPVPVSYDAAYTLGSALIAVLMCGVAFLIVHFASRSTRSIAIAGAVLGNGIVVMHYVGMSGIRGCIPTFEPVGIALAILGGTMMGIAALYISYTRRSFPRIFAGATIFGLSVVLVHFVAMGWTGFRAADDFQVVAPIINHGMLALLVMISAFVICGAFLLSTTNFVFGGFGADKQPTGNSDPAANASPAGNPQEIASHAAEGPELDRLPYERDRRTYFAPLHDIIAIRAEGHYSIIYTADEKLFCPLSISTIEKRLSGETFLRTHRSYLVNIDRVAAFERAKDNGRCLFDQVSSLESAPVSRTFVPQVKIALGI